MMYEINRKMMLKFRPELWAWLPVLVVCALVLSACGGGSGNTPVASDDGAFTLRGVDSLGTKLSAEACGFNSTPAAGLAHDVELHAYADGVLGLELDFDPAGWHVFAIERGPYFGADDLYLEVTSHPGTVAIGGWHLDGSEPVDSLVATVTFAPGPGSRTVSALLPTTTGCTPLDFGITDEGDGSITLNWRYNCTGDYTQDGLVALTDITPVGIHYDKNHTAADWATARLADGTGDNFITVGDLTPIGQNYERGITGYKVEMGSAQAGPFSAIADVAQSTGTGASYLEYGFNVAAPVDGGWYRVRAYHASDEPQGAATVALQVSLLPPGENPVSVPAADVMSGLAPLMVNLSDGGSTDGDGTIVQWLWDLNEDLVFEVDATAALGSTSHVYENPGSYYARLKVVDNDGRSDVEAVTISVSGLSDPPLAQAYATPNQGWGPLSVNFSAFGSADPDGSITAWAWDFDGDGLYETDATAEQGYAAHLFTTPGVHTVTLQVTDDTLNTATQSITVNVWDATASTVDYWTIFDQTQVRRVDLTVSQQNWDLMWQDVNAEVEVEADAVVFGTSLPRIGLRMKGNSSLTNPSNKKPWKIDTNEFDDLQEYENLKMLIFNNGFKDPSLAREALAYEMMQFGGVCASNTCFVEIHIEVGTAPSEFWGVYTMVERVDEKFLNNRYGNKSGNLYKGNFGADFDYRGSTIGAYPVYDGEPCYAKKTNEDENDYSDLLNLLDVLNNTGDAEFADTIETVFNVDSYLRYLAVTLLHSNLDIHMYMNQNFYLYNNPDTGRFEFIPWDLNESWGTFGDGNANESHTLYSLMTGVGGPGTPSNVLFERIMEVDDFRQTLAAYYDLLLREYFIADEIGAKAKAIHDLVNSYVKQGDKMYSGPGSMYSYTDFDNNWQADIGGGGPNFGAFGLKPFTATRVAYANAHLLADL